MMPALYQLLPWYNDALVDAQGHALDIYRAQNWQTTVVESIAEFIRLYTTLPEAQNNLATRRKKAVQVLQGMLDEAQALHALLQNLDPKKALLGRGPGNHPGWLVLVGKDRSTRWQATLGPKEKNRRYVRFAAADPHVSVDPKVSRAQNIERLLLGDATVPLVSSVPHWPTGSASCVCVRKTSGALKFATACLVPNLVCIR